MRRFALRAAIAVACVAAGISLGIVLVPGASATSGVPSASAVSRIPAGTITFVNLTSTRCIGIDGGKAGIFNCSYLRDQAWSVIRTRKAGGVYWAQLENNSGQCLGVAGNSAKAGARVVAQKCNRRNRSQYWNNTKEGVVCSAGFTPIVNLKSGDVVGVSGGATGNGSPVVIFTYQKTCNNQFWVSKVDLTRLS
jgi:Ricin-type beta-trefoil lectin domain-like